MLDVVPAHERIHIDSYAHLCSDLPHVYYKSTEEAHDFLLHCERDEVEPCILVTGCCDFSIREQNLHHPNQDLVKLANTIDWKRAAADRQKYQGVQVGPACKPERCQPQHKYAARTDRFTWWTIDELPKNIVRWYTTNLDVDHPRMRWLPFGLNNHGPGSSYIDRYVGGEKTKWLYANFTPFTFERLRLREWCETQEWITYRENSDLPIEEFLDEVASHRYVLCPFGNGLDCYRTYEAMYLQSIPIIEDSIYARHALNLGLPLVAVQNMASLTREVLERSYEPICNEQYDYAPLTKSYWRRVFEQESKELQKA